MTASARTPARLFSRRSLVRSLAAGSAATGMGMALAPTATAKDPNTPWTADHVEHPGGTPDQTAIQDALDAALPDGGHITVGAGVWNVEVPLRIHAGTRLTLAPGTTLLRTGETTTLLSNGPRDGSDTTTGGYDGPGDIIVEGGVWDVNVDNNPRPAWGIVFGHARNITVQDLEIRNVPEWHAIEYNAIYNGLIQNCSLIRATPRANGPWNAEALSIDLAYPGLQPFGAGDYTPSEMIRIIGNHCEDWPTFAGCHSGYGGVWHNQFVISDNTMTNLSYWGVSLRNASRAVITGNTMFDVGGGVWLRPTTVPELQSVTSIVISDNVIDTTTRNEGIRLAGQSESGEDGQIYGASVTGNVIRRANTAGIVTRWSPEAHISDNSIFVTGAAGIEAQDCDLAVIATNYIRDSQDEGLLVSGGRGQQVTGNSVVNAGRAAPASTPAVRFNDVELVSVQGTTVRTRSGASKPSHAMVSNAGSSDIAYTNNDVRDSFATAAFDMQGSGHVNNPPNIA
ncbi:NosD domain-containing protein [Phytoactinopolyspora endophytica]|uniref:NosD domain-containing protein n=1 Tax=Phytoactinopolyspora endophytica TaxID=1642495 RepID=UPI00101D5917|nr:right-handed parallel beta-helix repeat-containing protein [Phytoactinopolyspora endophytica]